MSRPSMLPGKITSTFPFDSLLHFGYQLAHRPPLQQIRSRSLLPANRAAEFGHKESRFHGFAEGPSRRVAPLSRQSHVGALDLQNVARDFDAHALPRHSIGCFHSRILPRQPIPYPSRIQYPPHPQPVRSVTMQHAGSFRAVEIDLVGIGNHAEVGKIEVGVSALKRIVGPSNPGAPLGHAL